MLYWCKQKTKRNKKTTNTVIRCVLIFTHLVNTSFTHFVVREVTRPLILDGRYAEFFPLHYCRKSNRYMSTDLCWMWEGSWVCPQLVLARFPCTSLFKVRFPDCWWLVERDFFFLFFFFLFFLTSTETRIFIRDGDKGRRERLRESQWRLNRRRQPGRPRCRGQPPEQQNVKAMSASPLRSN